jgi:hypothetical protein
MENLKKIKKGKNKKNSHTINIGTSPLPSPPPPQRFKHKRQKMTALAHIKSEKHSISIKLHNTPILHLKTEMAKNNSKKKNLFLFLFYILQ